MGSRGNESGMDFEFENRTGPLDMQSPFAKIARDPYSRKRMSHGYMHHNEASKLTTKAGTNNAFDSPTRSPYKNMPAFNSHFTTPRKPRPEIDDSSAGETPRSPDNVDSDATPDIVNARSALTRFDIASKPLPTMPSERDRGSPTKEKERDRPSTERRESWAQKIRKAFHSPGRGEIARPNHSGAIEKKVKRRREQGIHRQVARRRRHSGSDSGDESEIASQRKTSGHASEEKKAHWLSTMFTFIAQHPTVPHILSFYAQLLFNIFLLAGCAYLIWSFWSAVQGDVDKKSHEAMGEILAEMAVCTKSWTENRCDPSTRLPALETVCNNWYKCMNQDPARVGRAKVSAHTFAEIFNSFVEPISWKAMIFTFGLVFACFFTTNMAFGIFRDKTTSAGPQFQPQYFPPPTPQRTFSGQDGGMYYTGGAGPGTTWHQPPMALEPQPSGIEGRSSPVRRLAWN